MGEQADYLTEQGEEAYLLHFYGECGGDCEYCREEEDDKWEEGEYESEW